MKYTMLITAVLAVAVPAEPPQNPPAPATPQIAVVKSVNPATRTLILNVTKQVSQLKTKYVTKSIIVDGQPKPITEAVTEMVLVPVTMQFPWSAADLKATDVAGNPISEDNLFKRLKQDDGVILIPKGQKIQPADQKLFRKDAVVLEQATP